MFFFWLSSSGLRKVQRGGGYFNCPECRRRQPCTLRQVQTRHTLWGLPLGGGQPVGPESYLCLACHREFLADGSYGYDYGLHAEPQTWRCFKCNGEVPYERFDCPHCGYTFDPNRRV